jgi:hypothetical protein
LTAVARLVLGEKETRAQFEAEPTAFRWIFHREGTDVWIQLLELADSGKHDKAGTEIWSSWQTIAAGPVPRHPQPYRADRGLDLLADRAVTGVAGVVALDGVPGVTQVRGQLRLQSTLQHRLDQSPSPVSRSPPASSRDRASSSSSCRSSITSRIGRLPTSTTVGEESLTVVDVGRSAPSITDMMAIPPEVTMIFAGYSRTLSDRFHHLE